jgi:hypothetical protein
MEGSRLLQGVRERACRSLDMARIPNGVIEPRENGEKSGIWPIFQKAL